MSYVKPMSKKRKQKQNRRKAKKAKEARREANCERVVDIIAPQHPVNDGTAPIGQLFLHFEGTSGLLKTQKPYVQLAFDKGLFTKESQDIIKQYLCFNLNENDDDDEVIILILMTMMKLIAVLMVMLKIVITRRAQNSIKTKRKIFII